MNTPTTFEETCPGDIVVRLTNLLRTLDGPVRPIAVQPLSDKAEIYRFRLLPESDCDQIVRIISKLDYRDSEVFLGTAEGYRTSRDVFLDKVHIGLEQEFQAYMMPVLNEITEAIWNWDCNALSDVSFLEYRPGTYYKEHVDAAESQLFATRHVSFLIYLSDDFAGGETRFRRQSVIVTPQRGYGIVFPAGITHPHESMVVRSGLKYVLGGWLTRTRGHSETFSTPHSVGD
jgi:hypothetical protein